MKLILLAFAIGSHCLVLRGQGNANSTYPKKWIKTEFYIYEPSKDNLSEEKYTSEYARDKYRAFKGFQGWRGEYLKITSDSTLKTYLTGNSGKRFGENTYFRSKSLYFSPTDTIEVLMLSDKCLVLHYSGKFFDVYSAYKKRKKVDYCSCVIVDLIMAKRKEDD